MAGVAACPCLVMGSSGLRLEILGLGCTEWGVSPRPRPEEGASRHRWGCRVESCTLDPSPAAGQDGSLGEADQRVPSVPRLAVPCASRGSQGTQVWPVGARAGAEVGIAADRHGVSGQGCPCGQSVRAPMTGWPLC